MNNQRTICRYPSNRPNIQNVFRINVLKSDVLIELTEFSPLSSSKLWFEKKKNVFVCFTYRLYMFYNKPLSTFTCFMSVCFQDCSFYTCPAFTEELQKVLHYWKIFLQVHIKSKRWVDAVRLQLPSIWLSEKRKFAFSRCQLFLFDLHLNMQWGGFPQHYFFAKRWKMNSGL